MQGLLVILGLVAFILLLPAVLPFVAVLVALDRRWLRLAAERFACERCGRVLGQVALARGDAAWAEHFAALRHQYPYSKLRVVRDVYAVCPDCGARYGYNEKARTFRVLLTGPQPSRDSVAGSGFLAGH